MALTNTYLADIAYDIIQRRYMFLVNNWAGQRLMCVGDYAWTKDLPPGIFSQEEIDAMNSEDYAGRLQPYLLEQCPYVHTCSQLGPNVKNAPDSLGLHSLIQRRTLEGACLRDLVTPHLLYDAPRQDWVIINLVSKEFIQIKEIILDDIEDCPSEFLLQPLDPDCDGYNFNIDRLIVSRICWSSDNSFAMDTEGLSYEIYRGPWAGHRFLITTKSRLGSTEQWKDVSEQAIRDMKPIRGNIYSDEEDSDEEDEYGTDYRSSL
ncbi:hypothetical protein K474DRAFT_1710622 [Panus rudis PR-1116 ss-1]|nr:hypothetical protein K474DRAFT_1710622 [Panus rudis PR-1116 ss-1]